MHGQPQQTPGKNRLKGGNNSDPTDFVRVLLMNHNP